MDKFTLGNTPAAVKLAEILTNYEYRSKVTRFYHNYCQYLMTTYKLRRDTRIYSGFKNLVYRHYREKLWKTKWSDDVKRFMQNIMKAYFCELDNHCRILQARKIRYQKPKEI